MARYSRRRGPTVAFALTSALAQIPDLIVTRFFDHGELLISWNLTFGNFTGVNVNFQFELRIDGVNVYASRLLHAVANNFNAYVGSTIIVPVVAGIHTIDLAALGSDTPTNNVDNDTGHLTVIQLPHWDQDTDIL